MNSLNIKIKQVDNQIIIISNFNVKMNNKLKVTNKIMILIKHKSC
jgi:hypothetical protein